MYMSGAFLWEREGQYSHRKELHTVANMYMYIYVSRNMHVCTCMYMYLQWWLRVVVLGGDPWWEWNNWNTQTAGNSSSCSSTRTQPNTVYTCTRYMTLYSILPNTPKACRPNKPSAQNSLWCRNGDNPKALLWSQAPPIPHHPIMPWVLRRTLYIVGTVGQDCPYTQSYDTLNNQSSLEHIPRALHLN